MPMFHYLLSSFSMQAHMHLSAQPILCNPDRQKFIAASSMASGAKVANFQNDSTSQK